MIALGSAQHRRLRRYFYMYVTVVGSARHRWPLHNVYTYVKALRNVRGGSMQMLDRLGLR